MNADVALKMAEATLKCDMPFSEIIGKLIDEGVEYYHVDYVSCSFSFYGAIGSVFVAPLEFQDLPEVASEFSVSKLRSAILDSQQNDQKFRQFSTLAMQSGVQSYFVFLQGRRVLYIGRQGDQNLEWFPGAKGEDT